MRLVLISGCVAITVLACSKKSGRPIGAPLIKPPVENNLPLGLKGGLGLHLQATDTNAGIVAAIKEYLYPTDGFVGPMERLGKVDERMAELDSRSKESERACLSETATDYNYGTTMPGSATFTMKFQCQEELSSPDTTSQQMGFGLADDLLYLEEHSKSTDGGGILVFAQGSTKENSSEIWDIRYSAANTATNSSDTANVALLHIKGGDTSGAEFTVSGSVSGTGSFWCGVHVKSNSSYIYVEGKFPQGTNGCDTVESKTLCFEASGLAETDLTNCTGASLNTFALTSLSSAVAEAYLANAKTLVDTTISGYTDFNKDKSN